MRTSDASGYRTGDRDESPASAGCVSPCQAPKDTLSASERGLPLFAADRRMAREPQRERIAAELHDGLGQTLTALKFCVEDAQRLLGKKCIVEAEGRLELATTKIQEAADEVRRIGMELRPSTLDDLGLLATISWFAREYQKVYRHITVRQNISLEEKDVLRPLKTTIFRIIQEAMNNIAKHSGASIANIDLKTKGGGILLSIEDDGVGFDEEEVAACMGLDRNFGLANIRDRAVLSEGQCAIRSIPGSGTTVCIIWPGRK